MVILLFAASQNVFAETSITIPNEVSDPSCADSGSCFLPSEISVSVGDTVTWTNDSSVIHTVTSGNSNDGLDGTFDSQIIIDIIDIMGQSQDSAAMTGIGLVQ